MLVAGPFNFEESNLNIELEKGTSILNIAYRDTDPNLVLPVIRRFQAIAISRDRSKSIRNGLALKQVEQFRNKQQHQVELWMHSQSARNCQQW